MRTVTAMFGNDMMRRLFLLSISAISLSSCAVGPNYHKPKILTPTTWRSTQTPGESQLIATSSNPAWWKEFNDPILTRLENKVATSNLDLKVASLRMMQSQAEKRIASAAQLPHMETTASYARERASTNGVLGLLGTMEREGTDRIASGTQGFGPASMPGSVGNPSFNLPQYGMSASWEIDFWGHVRRQVEAATAAVRATQELRRNILVSLMAETAQDYIDLRTAQKQIEILEHNIEIANNSVKLTTLRFREGVATRLDLAESLGQLHMFSSRLAPLKAQATHSLNALSFLVAQEPGTLDAELGKPGNIPLVPAFVPIGLPSELADRRPDIRMAAERLHAATANIGVAIADFFPRVTLSGSLDVQALQFSGLGSWASRQYGFGPTATFPIFEGGRLTGQLHLRRAQQKEAAIELQRTVLKAWQEIDDTMADFKAAQRRRDELSEAVHENKIAVETATAQYVQGSSDFLNVLTLQNALLSSESSLTDAQAHVSLAVTTLYRALGGGWEESYPRESTH